MRIAQVAPPWLAVPPAGYGGIEWVVALLADGLVDAGHDVTLFATGDSVTRATLTSVVSEAPGSTEINSVWLDTLQTFVAFENPDAFDVIHTHLPFSQAVAASMLSAPPVVHTLHGACTDRARAIYERVADRMWFVAISEAQRATYPDLRWGGVVYNGIDPARYPLRTEKEDFLLFMGRAAPEKGLRRAVETARLTGDRLVIAVKVAAQTEIDEWESLQPMLPEGTVVLGEIGHEEKVDLYGRAKAVLFPIDWDEPFGLVMTEAMACGTPVIATPRGSVTEVIDDGVTGVIVPVEGYAEAAAAALEDIGAIDPAVCRAHVVDRFSVAAMVAGYQRVYQRAVA